MKIVVYGSGCSSCHKLYDTIAKVIKEKKLNSELVYITDLEVIMSKGIMMMPALEIDDKIVSMGRVYNEKEIINLLNNEAVVGSNKTCGCNGGNCNR
jgi:small redox-active disulfide protein 2